MAVNRFQMVEFAAILLSCCYANCYCAKTSRGDYFGKASVKVSSGNKSRCWFCLTAFLPKGFFRIDRRKALFLSVVLQGATGIIKTKCHGVQKSECLPTSTGRKAFALYNTRKANRPENYRQMLISPPLPGRPFAAGFPGHWLGMPAGHSS
jgi:hypothetical protein